MLIYLLLIAYIFLLRVFVKSFDTPTRKKTFLVFSALAIILVSGLRYMRVGGFDPINYFNNYEQAPDFFSFSSFMMASPFEDGYDISVKILSSIFTGGQYALLFSSIFVTICVCIFLYKNSEDLFLSILFYITLGSFLFTMSGMRQAIAMSICLLGIEFIKNKKLIPFIIAVLFASFFHRTAIIFLPVYFIARRKFDLKNNIISAFAIVILLFTYGKILEFANTYFERQYSNVVESGGVVAVLIYVFAISGIFIFKNSLFKDSKNIIFANLLILGFIAFIMRYIGAQAAERISFYFYYALLIVLPNTIKSIEDIRLSRTIYILSAMLAIALFIYRLNATGNTYIPYNFFWQ